MFWREQVGYSFRTSPLRRIASLHASAVTLRTTNLPPFLGLIAPGPIVNLPFFRLLPDAASTSVSDEIRREMCQRHHTHWVGQPSAPTTIIGVIRGQ
jgi:hypothetical protein